MTNAVDKEGGSAIHTTAHTALKVLMDTVRVEMIASLLCKSGDIEPNDPSVLVEMSIAERILVFVEVVVHLPELVLCIGGFGGFGCMLARGKLRKTKRTRFPNCR